MTTPPGCTINVEALVPSYPVSTTVEVETKALSAEHWVIARRDSPALWLQEVQKEIEALIGLEHNWDSYGASPVQGEAIAHAIALVRELSLYVNVKAPTVTATPDGCVGLCWDTGDWSLDASIDHTGLIGYVFLDEQDPSQEREGRTRSLGELVALLTQW